MNYTFADRVGGLQPSVIREILKYASVPGMISFAAGYPAPEAFPVDDIAAISADVYANTPINALQYSVTEGYQPLKDTIKARYSYLFGEGDDVIIVADPFDTTDHNQDGYGVYGAERFIYNFTFFDFFGDATDHARDKCFVAVSPIRK